MVVATLMGLGVYLVLELLFGNYGIIAYRSLERFRDKAVIELEDLRRQTSELQRQVRRLTTDSETVRLEARDIGLVGRDDVVIRLENRDPRPRHRYEPGAMPVSPPRVRDNRPLFRSLGFTVFLLTLLVQVAATRNNAGRQEEEPDEADQTRERHSR